MEPEQQIHVRDTQTAKQAWDALKSQFARESILQKVRLRQQYYSLKFQKGGNMLEHINQLRSLHDQLKEMGETVNDKDLAMTLLASLPEKLLITALDAVSFDKVKGMLLNDNDRMCDAKKQEDVFSARRGNINTKSKIPEKTFNGTCHFCHERGHFARDCRKAKLNTQKNEKEKKGSAHCAENENNESVTDHDEALITSNVANMSDWIIDSGATLHYITLH